MKLFNNKYIKLCLLISAIGLFYFTNNYLQQIKLNYLSIASQNSKQNKNVNSVINMQPAYDLSQWQTQFTDQQVQQLKSEASFVILRVQYGSQLKDSAFQHNLILIQKYNIPYGVYSYSLYKNATDARNEAKQLYQLAPKANFYVNDYEENNIKNDTITNSTIAWANTIKQLTNKPRILYSGLSFMNDNLIPSQSAYNAIWLASYSAYEPNPTYHYDLWQYTDKQVSTALSQNVDASIIPASGKSLSFWTGQQNKSKSPQKINVHPSKYKKNTSNKKSTKIQSHKIVKENNSKKVNFNPAYYSDPSIKQLQVKSKSGVSIYNKFHVQVMQCFQGNVIQVEGFRKLGKIQQAITPNGNYFTANKKLVGQYHGNGNTNYSN